MLRFYKYIYYRAYLAGLRGFGSARAAVWGACVELGGLMILNVLGISGLLQEFTGYQVFDGILHASIWQQAGVLLLFGLWVDRVWGSTEKAKAIAREFEKVEETKRQHFWRGAGINAYEGGWLILNIACALFVH